LCLFTYGMHTKYLGYQYLVRNLSFDFVQLRSTRFVMSQRSEDTYTTQATLGYPSQEHLA
jgi:hypothetical protein